MATEGCMKMEPIPVPMDTKVIKVDPVVTEVPADERTDKPFFKETIICSLPPAPKFTGELKQTKISRKFDCEYPSVEPNVYRTPDPLPFPDNLHDLISWTDAFVDRIASMTQAGEKKTKSELARRDAKIEDLRTKLAIRDVELNKSRHATEIALDKVEKTKHKLATANSESAARQRIIEQMKDEAKAHGKRELDLKRQIADLKAELSTAKTTIKKQQESFAAADEEAARRFQEEHKEHMEDHNALEETKKALANEQEEKHIVEVALASERAKLADAKCALAKESEINRGLNETIKSQATEIEKLTKHSEELEVEIAKLENALGDSQHQLEAAKKVIVDLSGEVTAAKERICGLEKEILSVKQTNASLEDDKKKLTLERDAAKSEITTLNDAVSKATKENEQLSTRVGVLEKDLATAQDAKAKLGAALLQAQKEKKQAMEARDEAETAQKDAENALQRAETAKNKAVAALKEEQKTHETEMDGLRVIAEGKISPADVEAAEAKAKALQVELDAARFAAKKAEDDVKALQKRLIPNPNNKRINILSVEYGGKAYNPQDDKKVFEKLYAAAEKKTSFKIDNDFFIHDPWHHHCKSFSITYQVNGEGALRHLHGKEGDKTCFN